MILVTGAMGTVGSELVPELVEKGARVRGGIHTPGLVAAAPEVTCKVMDYLRPETLDAALFGCRRLFLLTPLHPEQGQMARNMMEAAQRNDVEYVVGLSCMAAPDSTVGGWHREVERAVAQSGIPYDLIRANTFMQNLVLYAGADIRTHRKLYAPEGATRMSYVDVRDAAAVAAALLLREKPGGETFHITGSEAVSNEEVATILSETTGRDIEYDDISDEMYRDQLRDQGLPPWHVEAMVEMSDFRRRGLAADVTSVVTELTGKRPIVFGEFARNYVDAFLNERPGRAPRHEAERRTGARKSAKGRPASRS